MYTILLTVDKVVEKGKEWPIYMHPKFGLFDNAEDAAKLLESLGWTVHPRDRKEFNITTGGVAYVANIVAHTSLTSIRLLPRAE